MVSIFGKNRIKLIDDEEEERNEGLFPRFNSILRSNNNRGVPAPPESEVFPDDEDRSMRSLDERCFSNIEDASGETDWLDCHSSANLNHSLVSDNGFLQSIRIVHSTPPSVSVRESPLATAENRQEKFQPDSSGKGFLGDSNPCQGSILLGETDETVAEDIEGSERYGNRTSVSRNFFREEADELISPGLSGRRSRLERPGQLPSPSQGFDLEAEGFFSPPSTTVPKFAQSVQQSMVSLENSDSSRSRRSLPSSLRRKSSLKDEESHRRSLRSSRSLRQSAGRQSVGDSPHSHSSRRSTRATDQPSDDPRKEADRLAERSFTSISIAKNRQRIKNDDDMTNGRHVRSLGCNKNEDEASAENSRRSSRTKDANTVQERRDVVPKQDDSGRKMERSRRGDGWTTPRTETESMKVVIPAVVVKTKLCQVELNAILKENERRKHGSRTIGDHDIGMKQNGSRTQRPSCNTSGFDMSNLTQAFDDTPQKQRDLRSSKLEPVTCDSNYTVLQRFSTEVLDSGFAESYTPKRATKPAATNPLAQRLSTPRSRETSKLHPKALNNTELGPTNFSPCPGEGSDRKDAWETDCHKKDYTSVINWNWEEDIRTSNSKNSFNAVGGDDENGFGSPIVHAKMKIGANTPDLVNFLVCHDKKKTSDCFSTKSLPCRVLLKEPSTPDHIRKTSSNRKSSRRATHTETSN
jgi:hypothetical protein